MLRGAQRDSMMAASRAVATGNLRVGMKVVPKAGKMVASSVVQKAGRRVGMLDELRAGNSVCNWVALSVADWAVLTDKQMAELKAVLWVELMADKSDSQTVDSWVARLAAWSAVEWVSPTADMSVDGMAEMTVGNLGSSWAGSLAGELGCLRAGKSVDKKVLKRVDLTVDWMVEAMVVGKVVLMADLWDLPMVECWVGTKGA